MKKKGLGIMGLIVGILAVFGLTLTGCVTTPEPGHLQEKELVHKSEIMIGSSFSFKNNDLTTGKVTTWSRVVEKRAPHKNRGVFYWKKLTEINERKPTGERYRLYDSGLNAVAIVRDGIETRSFYPSRLLFQWPLYVGKRWTNANLRSRSLSSPRLKRYLISVKRVVELKEEVKVPAGTFQAVRIESISPNTKAVYWYAPRIGMKVKRIVITEGTKTSVLELTNYYIPHIPSP